MGAGFAGVIAAGLYAFFTQNPKGKKIAKDGKMTMTDITREVVARSEKIKKISKKAYDAIVDDVLRQYQDQKKMTAASATELALELKKEWNAVKKELQKK